MAHLISPSITQYIPREKCVQFQETVQFKPLHKHANIPTQSTKGSIGYDITSSTSTILQPNTITKIPTGVSTSMTKHMYCRIAPRSRLSLKGISVEAGVIDSDYTGKYIVILCNHTNKPIPISMNQKIAQLIFEQAATPYIQITKSLQHTQQGDKGFGSTNTMPKLKYSTTSTPLPILPPTAPSNKLINRKQNWA